MTDDARMSAQSTVVMGEAEAEAYILRLLAERGPMTTMQIEKLARDQHRKCPDHTVVFLTKMRRKGLIKGEASLERRGWLWWVSERPQ
jgi:hypothetical protein